MHNNAMCAIFSNDSKLDLHSSLSYSRAQAKVLLLHLVAPYLAPKVKSIVGS